MPRAALILQFKATQGPLLLEMVLWELPKRTKDRPQGVKYRLYLGRSGKNLIRYDNESGKGDHRHLGPDQLESRYEFSTVERLLEDFRRDCENHGWRWDK